MNKYILLLSIFFLGFFTSCEKVIELDLNTSSSQMVIEGNIYDEPGPYTVKISRSVNIDEPSVYPAVKGATVTISDNAGNTQVLAEKDSGVYQTSTLQGVPGRTYTLSVEVDGQIYTAISTMPDGVNIDTLYTVDSGYSGLYQVCVDLTDPANTTNYYRLVDFVNGKRLSTIIVANDELSKGKKINGTLMYSEDDMKSGDTYTLWLESIDKGVYNYFNTASTNGQDSASPSNPDTNISNGALGYFNACSVRKKSIVIL